MIKLTRSYNKNQIVVLLSLTIILISGFNIHQTFGTTNSVLLLEELTSESILNSFQQPDSYRNVEGSGKDGMIDWEDTLDSLESLKLLESLDLLTSNQRNMINNYLLQERSPSFSFHFRLLISL